MLVEGSVIADIRPAAAAPAVADRVLLPGLVDLHAHLREPGQEAAETVASGTRAAATGGFTDVFAMPNTEPAMDSVERVEALERIVRAGASARVHPIAAVTLGRQGTELVDVVSLLSHGVRVFSDDGSCVDDPALVAQILAATSASGGVFAQHAQSRELAGSGVVHSRIAGQLGVEGWPALGEEAVIARDLGLLAEVGGHLHVCHISTRGAVELIREAKRKRLRVTSEVTPHHLVLTDEDVVREGAALKVNPPLREAADVAALREALRDGTIDIVATDHAPHPLVAKQGSLQDAAFGLIGFETALSVVADVLVDHAGRTDWAAVAQVLAYRPAAIGSLPPESVSQLRVGDAATFCVVETESSPRLPPAPVSKSRNTPFAKHRFRSRVTRTVLEGRDTHRS
ncbi:dihydroorotase [Agrococcus sp. Marseille-Q4369]|uniref:dihydroorotase n=1 Tax=Agrococcus sp. Marseille-Q4369 TaxID=2810513 RepID=UPI001B8BF837|nr:dihydroorotase [Agrococcus sp. Marseille-Q4369]QUW17823.1 dihydroorotase [Agrococcus sp. Marseille-Q4369]